MTDDSAAIRLHARIDRRDLWGIEADLRQVLAERDQAVRQVAAVRELAEKWAGEPTAIEAFLANSILKAIDDASGTGAPSFKEGAPNLNSDAPD